MIAALQQDKYVVAEKNLLQDTLGMAVMNLPEILSPKKRGWIVLWKASAECWMLRKKVKGASCTQKIGVYAPAIQKERELLKRQALK